MWITTTGGFVSLVEDREDPGLLQVRARVLEDITANFPGAEVLVVPGADYRYRARVNRQQVADRLAAAVMAIDYPGHFKDVAIQRSPANAERYAAYYGTWAAMARMQDYAPYSAVPRPSQPQWWDEDER
jgi:hypothetical protein